MIEIYCPTVEHRGYASEVIAVIKIEGKVQLRVRCMECGGVHTVAAQEQVRG